MGAPDREPAAPTRGARSPRADYIEPYDPAPVSAEPVIGRSRSPSALRLYASTIDEPRARRATDAVMLAAATLVLGVLSVAAEPLPAAAGAVSDVFAVLPDFLDVVWQILSDGFVLFALVLVVAALVRRRLAVARDVFLAVAVATLVWLVIGRLVEGSWPAVLDALDAAEPPPWYPSPRIALAGAVVLTSAPHLALPIRRLGRRLLFLDALALIALGATTVLGAFAGYLIAVIGASVVHLIFGSSGGRPSLSFVADSLDELGIPVRSLGAADRQETGLFRVDAIDPSGNDLVIDVYGRDAFDTAIVRSVGRMIWYREPGTSLRVGRRQQV
jgi:glycosyltransferase 2 family protein